MKRAIAFLTTRVLRSRLGIALVIVVVVLGIVGAARLLAGPIGLGSDLTGHPTRPISTVDPNEGDDGANATAPPSPATKPGATAPEVVARRFATAWLAHGGVSAEQWQAALRPLSTSTLTEKLTGVDPVTVPAQRLTGEPVVIPQTERFVEVTMAVDTGQLRLELVSQDGQWLVDAVDWERS
ncbi:hypothetical protein GCM10027280_34420 [Micromonospora polyrhachis]|uniref:Uncharacterized protein n=1 Tax=Micromonospora polyrhachis TaxID=1282883 RepID=A0A7W7SR82_9ACTN|nr:hypothetical protein [Micromonospora polyrhachis]MBB4959484.1 hypothetical protein [Micromonospora polyrhachis]